MRDFEAIRLAVKIRKATQDICDAMERLRSEHPNGEDMYDELADNGLGVVTDAVLCVADHTRNARYWINNYAQCGNTTTAQPAESHLEEEKY
jgi:hypothetical protein